MAQLLSAIIALLNDASLKADDETAYLLLVAVGHFLYCNNAAVDLAKVLDLNALRFTVGKPQAIAQEIQRMLT